MEIREEKQTDVNLACKMVADACGPAKDNFDIACLVSNDGDFAAVLKVLESLNQQIILILPIAQVSGTSEGKRGKAKALTKYVPLKNRIYTVDKDLVKDNLLPPEVAGIKPPNHKGWSVDN